ncbi:MAG TPA: hypothetical protein VMT37_06570 [Solirubrobacterales bacterium]|nr:hypothetical protein [Solirubrobacterales bacterium]
MGGSSRLRLGALALLGVLAALSVALFLGDSSSDAEAASGYRPPRVDQTQMLLRLHDLPTGYVNGYLGEGRGEDGILCESLRQSRSTPAPLARFVGAFRPKGCIAAYDSVFTAPGEEPRAPLVYSGAMALGSDAAADAAWRLVPTLLSRVTKHQRIPASEPSPLRVGSEARLFHTTAVPFTYGRPGTKASFLAWRSGNVVAVIMAISDSFAETDATVAEMAPRQQAHVRKPTPYTAPERYDGEVVLDDPEVDVPVYWLGRTFMPGGELISNRLYGAYYQREPQPEIQGHGPLELGEAPSGQLTLGYFNFQLMTWTSESWSVFADSASARALTGWHCTQKRTISLPDRTATIFLGYAKNYGTCPAKKPSIASAWVDVGGVKVVVNPPTCPKGCFFHTPYDSYAGMEAIVRGLKLRPKPVY